LRPKKYTYFVPFDALPFGAAALPFGAAALAFGAAARAFGAAALAFGAAALAFAPGRAAVFFRASFFAISTAYSV
jgi:hypothetical protein